MAKFFYVTKEVYENLLELQGELENIAKDFLYTPVTASNFSRLQGTIELCLTMHNQNCYMPHGFMACSSLNIDVNDVYGGIEFKSLIDDSKIIPCLQETDREGVTDAEQ